MMDMTIRNIIIPFQIIHIVDTLEIHGNTFQSVCEFHRDWEQFDTAAQLKIGELVWVWVDYSAIWKLPADWYPGYVCKEAGSWAERDSEEYKEFARERILCKAEIPDSHRVYGFIAPISKDNNSYGEEEPIDEPQWGCFLAVRDPKFGGADKPNPVEYYDYKYFGGSSFLVEK